MRSMHAGFSFVLALVLVSCRPTGPQSLSEQDVATINETAQRFVEGFRNRDDELAASVFTEDAIQLPPNAGPVEGRAGIRTFASQFPRVTDFSLTPREIVGRGDLAYRRGTYAITMDVGEPGGTVTDSGKFIEIWRRQADGSWRIDRDIWNSSLPAP